MAPMNDYPDTTPNPDNNPGAPDPDTCRRARLSRDPRFDGEFFLGVRTTGIYCRPICPARQAAEKNVVYFHYASQAAEAGFRPCLRCRPEAAPGSPAWNGSRTTLQRALHLIHEGALNGDGSLNSLASRLGVGERYLRKLFQRELGISPLAVAQNRRLLFAKQLLEESSLPMTEVAFAAGFSSVRRFNSALRETFGIPPSSLRNRARPPAGHGITLQLQYRPPYDWDGVIDFFSRHAIEGLELVTPLRYQRHIRWGDQNGTLILSPVAGKSALQLELELSDPEHLMPLVTRVRRMFDLDANPGAIAAVLGLQPALRPLLRKYPGIRSPLCWSASESVVRAIIGQQVSIGAARTVCARLARACGPPASFPDQVAIAGLADSDFAMPSRRRNTLRAACKLLETSSEDTLLTELEQIPGIGPWTLSMVAMRGLGDPDTFPRRDLGLIRAWETLNTGGQCLEQAALNWQPFRAYAANLLWRSL